MFGTQDTYAGPLLQINHELYAKLLLLERTNYLAFEYAYVCNDLNNQYRDLKLKMCKNETAAGEFLRLENNSVSR